MSQVVQQSPWSVLSLSPILLIKLGFLVWRVVKFPWQICWQWCLEGTSGSTCLGLCSEQDYEQHQVASCVFVYFSLEHLREQRFNHLFECSTKPPCRCFLYFDVQNLPSHFLWLSPLFCCLSVLRSVRLHCFHNTPSFSATIRLLLTKQIQLHHLILKHRPQSSRPFRNPFQLLIFLFDLGGLKQDTVLKLAASPALSFL